MREAVFRSRKRRRCQNSVIIFALILAAVITWPGSGDAQGNDDTTARLIQLLVEKGVLSRQQATELLSEARNEPPHPRPAKARSSAPTEGKSGETKAAQQAEPDVPKGTVRVTYVPKAVRDQIAAEVKDQLVSEGQLPGASATAAAASAWTDRIKISGDVRVRGERTFYDNPNYSHFPDFQSINGLTNGYDDTGTTAPPLLNTTQDRTLYRVRARLNVAANVTDWLDADIRVGTGNDTSPVSLNQTVGQPGDFSKYALWLDQAYLRFRPLPGLALDIGRAPNPFWTSELLFYRDLSFDGVSARYDYKFDRNLSLFVSGGAFPVYNTAYNFGTGANSQPFSDNSTAYPSHDAYLFAAQAGAQYRFNDDYAAKIAAGFFDFSHVQGELSAPCLAPSAFGSCNTDNTRAPFVQFGNTVFPIRNISPNPSSPTSTADPQFYGLASRFDVLDLHESFVVRKYSPIDVVFNADYVRNLGFRRASIRGKSPANNLDTDSSAYIGGNNGYALSVNVGHQELTKLWDWNLGLTYKYVESDAVLDALTDPNFHLGGTNAKGYIVEGNLALNKNVWITGSWLSSNEVSGPPYGINVLLLDLNAKF